MAGMCGGAALLAVLMPFIFRFVPRYRTKAEKEVQKRYETVR